MVSELNKTLCVCVCGACMWCVCVSVCVHACVRVCVCVSVIVSCVIESVHGNNGPISFSEAVRRRG